MRTNTNIHLGQGGAEVSIDSTERIDGSILYNIYIGNFCENYTTIFMNLEQLENLKDLIDTFIKNGTDTKGKI